VYELDGRWAMILSSRINWRLSVKVGDLIRPKKIHKGSSTMAIVTSIKRGIAHFVWSDGKPDRIAVYRAEVINEGR